MGGACSTYGGEERCIQDFGGGVLREGGHLEDPGIVGEDNIKVNLQAVGWGGMNGLGLERIGTAGGLL